jgi:MFS-type transporter involved in bile tolerance (Atg22 family)
MASAVYVVVFIVVGFYTEKFQNQRMWIMIASCIIPFVGMLVMSLLPNTAQYKWIKWGMYVTTVVFSLSIFIGWSLSKSLPPRQVKFSAGGLILDISPFKRRW